MYCKKCGKEIKDGSNFCTYCGADLTSSKETNEKRPGIEENKTTVAKKKWGVPLVIGICVAVVGVAAVVGGIALKKHQSSQVAQKSEVEVKEKPESKEEEIEKVENPTEFPKEITLNNEEMQGIVNLLKIVCNIDGADTGNNLGTNKEMDNDFASRFLVWSLWNEVPFANGKAVEVSQNGWNVPEEIVKTYLQNSINITEISSNNLIHISEGLVQVEGMTPTAAYYEDSLSIDQVMQISDSELRLQGEIHFASEFPNSTPYVVKFEVMAKKNSDSIWGGYTLKSIDMWKRLSRISLKDKFDLTASSVLYEKGYDHSVGNLTDSNPSTCWAEGVQGNGEQERITFTSREPQELNGLAILPGYLKSQKHYEKNGKPVEIQITCGTKTLRKNVIAEFVPDYNDPMSSMVYIDFEEPIITDTCTITILQAQAGGKYADLCISELDLYKYE